LLPNLPNEINAEAKILKLARMVEAAVESNSDIALACILLNQIHGIYPVRHCTDTAVVSILVARAMKKSTDEIMSITAAALTMNIGMLIYQEKLQQREGALSDAEFKAMIGWPMCCIIMRMKMAAAIPMVCPGRIFRRMQKSLRWQTATVHVFQPEITASRCCPM
jgi:hypothetical protein